FSPVYGCARSRNCFNSWHFGREAVERLMGFLCLHRAKATVLMGVRVSAIKYPRARVSKAPHSGRLPLDPMLSEKGELCMRIVSFLCGISSLALVAGC